MDYFVNPFVYICSIVSTDCQTGCVLSNLLVVECIRLNQHSNARHIESYRFVTGVIPPGNDDLKGDEVDTIIMFKNALGIEDPDAAAVHIEVCGVCSFLHKLP